MPDTRRQLSLLVKEPEGSIEKISLIEQKSKGVWKILEEFSFAEKS